jgi:YD repeat-containing protein
LGSLSRIFKRKIKAVTLPTPGFFSFTSVTDQNGKVTSYASDADRLTSVTDAAQNMTHYAYDLENNLSSITDAAPAHYLFRL